MRSCYACALAWRCRVPPARCPCRSWSPGAMTWRRRRHYAASATDDGAEWVSSIITNFCCTIFGDSPWLLFGFRFTYVRGNVDCVESSTFLRWGCIYALQDSTESLFVVAVAVPPSLGSVSVPSPYDSSPVISHRFTFFGIGATTLRCRWIQRNRVRRPHGE